MSFTPFERIINNVNGAVEVIDGCKNALESRGIDLAEKTAFDYPDIIENLPSPQLNPVTLTRNNDTVTINNPSTNGGFVGKYQLYNGETLLQEITGNTFSLIALGKGSYELHVVALASYFIDSIISNKINATVYEITHDLENLTADNPAALISNGTAYSVTLSPANGYYLPEDIIVTMGGKPCSYDYDSYTGVLSFAAVNGDLVIQAAALSAPKLRRPSLSRDGSDVFIAPPRYAENTKLYIDGELKTAYTGTDVQVYDMSDITEYGIYSVTAQSEAEGYDTSETAILAYKVGATIKIQGDILTVLNVRSGITFFDVYIDDVLVGRVRNNGTTLDLSGYAEQVEDGKHFVELNAIGEGVAENRSNAAAWFRGTAPIYGVSGLYKSSPALTRTDDAVDLDYVINASTGAVDSDFDSVFPWSEAEIVEDAAGKFLKMPDMYFRVGVDSENRITDIAVSAIPSGAGDWYEVPSFMYGCYGASVKNGKMRSVSGVERSTYVNRANFRKYATANGDGYTQLDLYHHTVMMFLWWIEFATKNSQAVMKGREANSGTGGGTSVCAAGGTDGLETPSGYETIRGQMRWHYIEDFTGNLLEFVDGIVMNTWVTPYTATADRAAYSDNAEDMETLSYKSPAGSGCIAAYGWDSDHPFLCMPCLVSGGNYNTYFCDQIANLSMSNPVLYCGSSYYLSLTFNGLSYCRSLNVGFTYYYLGARLLKLS